MRTDLNINYLELEIIAENISRYMQALMDIDDALMQLSRCLSEQTSEAVTALLEKIEEVRAVSNKRIATLDMLSKMTNDYVAKLRGLVDCETEGTITRVDSLDIEHNLNQIGFSVGTLDNFSRRPYAAYHVSYGDSPEELERRKKHERNYRKVDDFRENHLILLKNRIYTYWYNLYEIYEQKIIKYEEADDEYRKRIDCIYYEMTSIPDLVTNDIEFGWSVYWSYSKSFCTTAAIMAAFVAAPKIVAIGLIAYYIGCGCILYLPKEMREKGLMNKIYDHTDKTMQGLADLCIIAMDNGPIGVVEYIGQGYADRAQTPEGIASIAGDVLSLIVLNFAGKMLNTNVSPEKAEVKAVEGGTEAPRTIPQQLTRDGQVPVIGKMKDLNTPGNVVDGEFKIADYLPDKGGPKDNWHQNSGILRSVMNEGVPIKDVSMFPMDNAGFLGAERNLLQSRGWTYLDGYWYPPE